MTEKTCGCSCHGAGLALCADCQDHPVHEGKAKFEFEGDQTVVEELWKYPIEHGEEPEEKP